MFLFDLLSLTWSTNEYDAVVAIFIQFFGPELRAKMFQAMLDAVKPGGYFILQGYTVEQLNYKTGGPSVIENLYTEELIRELLNGFEICELIVYEEVVEEGSGHSGPSALLGVVARKP
jgi:cyclopropane fatty-acyl-phospholipid synthase-like methyltransferase